MTQFWYRVFLTWIKSWIKSYFNYNRQIILNASFKCKMLQ